MPNVSFDAIRPSLTPTAATVQPVFKCLKQPLNVLIFKEEFLESLSIIPGQRAEYSGLTVHYPVGAST